MYPLLITFPFGRVSVSTLPFSSCVNVVVRSSPDGSIVVVSIRPAASYVCAVTRSHNPLSFRTVVVSTRPISS